MRRECLYRVQGKVRVSFLFWGLPDCISMRKEPAQGPLQPVGVTSILTSFAWTSRDTIYYSNHLTYKTYQTYNAYYVQHGIQRIARSNGTLAVDCYRDPPPKPSQA